MQRSKWTPEEVREHEATHERVIAQYPDEIQRELRLARIKWLAKVKVQRRSTSESIRAGK